MIVEYIRYRIPSTDADAFLKACEAAVRSLVASEYCLGYELTQCEEEAERFILRILWTSTRDHLQGFRKSAEFRAFLPHVRPYIKSIEEMQHYRVTKVRSNHGIG